MKTQKHSIFLFLLIVCASGLVSTIAGAKTDEQAVIVEGVDLRYSIREVKKDMGELIPRLTQEALDNPDQFAYLCKDIGLNVARVEAIGSLFRSLYNGNLPFVRERTGDKTFVVAPKFLAASFPLLSLCTPRTWHFREVESAKKSVDDVIQEIDDANALLDRINQ